MSMPSSSEDVATRHGSSPAFSSSSTTVRSSRASEPWWARAISAARPRVGVGQLVEAQREPLGAAAVVDEDDRRAVLADELEQLGVDRRPDRAARRLAAGERVERVGSPALCVGLDHRLDRHVDLEVERLAHAGVDDRARAPRADHEAADLLERVLRRAEADALRRRGRPAAAREPLERERQVRAALRRRRRRGSRRRSPPRRRVSISRACEVSIRYSDSGVVMRMSGGVRAHRRALASAACRRCGSRRSRSAPMPAQRRAQVALDVVGERLERRDVDERGVLVASGSARRRGGRGPTGTRRASCPSRWARRSARARRWRSPATPAPGPASAPRTRARTSRGRRG